MKEYSAAAKRALAARGTRAAEPAGATLSARIASTNENGAVLREIDRLRREKLERTIPVLVARSRKLRAASRKAKSEEEAERLLQKSKAAYVASIQTRERLSEMRRLAGIR